MRQETFQRAKEIEKQKNNLQANLEGLGFVLESFNKTDVYRITIQEDGSERTQDLMFDRNDIFSLVEVMQHQIDLLNEEFETL